MLYNDLNSLLRGSGSSRRYFVSLPVTMQLALHEQNAYIHSAAQLHQHVYALESYAHHTALSESSIF